MEPPSHTFNIESYTVRLLIFLCVFFSVCVVLNDRGQRSGRPSMKNGDRQDVQKGVEYFLTHLF